jgi:hypothetical protein
MERPVKDFLMTSEATLQVKGKALGGSLDKVTVMGMEVTVGADGGFDTTITMSEEGMNEVLIVARDTAGNIATHTITVDYSITPPELTVNYDPLLPEIVSHDANLFIYVQTSAGIEEILITHTAGGESETTSYSVSPEGFSSVVKTLLDGDNTFSIEVTDAYGNSAESDTYTVNYRFKPVKGLEPGGEDIELWNFAVILLVISVALIATAVVVSSSFRKER